MGRKKRSEKLKGAIVKERPQARPAVVLVRPSAEMRSVFCPVCWTLHGSRRLEYPSKGYYSPPATENYWEREDLYPDDAPFGIIQEVGRGRGGSFQVLGYFGPEDDKDGFFLLVKERFLSALRKWLKRGWITKEEIENLL